MTSWNDNTTVKRWVLIGGAALLALLLLGTCVGINKASAATLPAAAEPYAQSSFDVVGQPDATRSVGQCWKWGFGPWESIDGFNRLRFGYGEDVVACANSKGTKWASLPTFDPYHYLGYWQYDGVNKTHGQTGYSFLDISTTWKFSFKPVGVPLLNRSPLLRCDLTVSDHTAHCTLYP